MDTPPTYQEATGKKSAWLGRLFGRLFRRTPPQSDAGVLLEQKMQTPLYPEEWVQPSSSKLNRKSYSRPTSLIGPSKSSTAWRNSVIHTRDQPLTNYVRIKRNNAPITGIWNIDTTLHVPPHLLVQFKDKTEARHHLHLWSVKQAINAVVNVVGDGKEVALITCSTLGKVNLQLDKPPKRLISVFCRGTVISVKIPRTYNGIVKAHTGSGSVHFSDEVAKRLSTIYEKDNESRHFIGEMKPGVPIPMKGDDADADRDEDRENEEAEAEAEAEGGMAGAQASGSGSGGEIQIAEAQEEKKYDVMKLKAKSREGNNYGEVFIAYSDEPDMPLRALFIR